VFGSSFRYFSQRSGKRSSVPAGISMRASDWRHSAINTLQSIEPPFDDQSIAKFGRATVADLGVDDHGIPLRLGHFCQDQTEFLSEERASDLDEAQICDVRHDAPAIGIEKHHLHLCPDMRPLDSGHSQQSFRKAF
jgi:hypothetical protein